VRLIDVLPRNSEEIVLSPAGVVNEEYVDGFVDPAWFSATFPELAAATVPLTTEMLNQLKSIDGFWSLNADRWRAEGII